MSALPLHHEYTAPLTHEQCQSEFLICILGTDGYRKYSANVTDLPKSDRAFFSLLNQRYWEEQRRLCRWLSWLSLTRVTDIELVEFSSSHARRLHVSRIDTLKCRFNVNFGPRINTSTRSRLGGTYGMGISHICSPTQRRLTDATIFSRIFRGNK